MFRRFASLSVLSVTVSLAPAGCSPTVLQPIDSTAIARKLGKPADEPEAITPPSTQPENKTQASAQDLAPASVGPPNPPAPVTAPPAAGPARDVKFPGEKVTVLPNGLTVIVAENHDLPTTDALLEIPGGSAAEPAALPGVADFIADMLKEGTTTQTKQQIAQAIESVGGYLGSWSARDTSDLSVHVLSKDLGMALGLMADVAEHPKLADTAIEKVRAEELSDLANSESSPRFLAARRLAHALYSDGPYSHFGSTKAALREITRKDLAAFHDRAYVPNGSYLVIVGDVKAPDAVRLAAAAFGSWKRGRGAQVALPAPQPPTGGTIEVVNRPGSVQAFFIIGEPALRRRSPDYLPLAVANGVLGGSPAARLFVDLREKQSLTYGAYSSLEEARGVGAFYASGMVRNQVVEQAWKGFESHLAALAAAPPSATEVKQAEAYMGGTFLISLQRPLAVASDIANAHLWGLPADYWNTYRTRIDAVTPREAFAAAKKYVHPAREVAVVVGDAKVLEPILSKYADLQVFDANGRLTGKVARSSLGGSSGMPAEKAVAAGGRKGADK